MHPDTCPRACAQELAGTRPGSAAAARRTMLLPSKIALVPGAVPLSRHPYGCRVVQRILEHCDVPAYKQDLLREVGRLFWLLSVPLPDHGASVRCLARLAA
jgi:hypothetical protein